MPCVLNSFLVETEECDRRRPSISFVLKTYFVRQWRAIFLMSTESTIYIKLFLTLCKEVNKVIPDSKLDFGRVFSAQLRRDYGG